MASNVFESITWPLILMTSCIAVWQVRAFPSGGPSYSCRKLTPGHSNGTQQGMPPYRISVSRQQLEAGGSTRVSIDSITDFPFLGFLCAVSELSDEKNETVGSMAYAPAFQQSNLLKTITCARSTPDTAVTHTSREEKWRVEFDWMSPINAFEGQQYKLRCSIVQSFFRCWTNIQTVLTVVSSQESSNRNPNTADTGNGIATTSQGSNLGTMPNAIPPVSPRNDVSTSRRNPGNNSVSPRNGAQREAGNNLLPSGNRISITDSSSDFINRPSEITQLAMDGGDSTRNTPQTQRVSFPASSVNSGRRFINQNDIFPSNSMTPNGNRLDGALSGLRARSLSQGQNQSPASAVGRRPSDMNQIASRPQQTVPFPSSVSGLNRNQINDPVVLSDFERALIFELLSLGINPLAPVDNRFQRRQPTRFSNDNAAMGQSFNNNNIQSFENQLSSLNVNRNSNVAGSTNSNSRFQDANLIRSDTMVFDAASVSSPFGRNAMVINDPNSRGLFQARNARTFNPVFSRIRNRNK